MVRVQCKDVGRLLGLPACRSVGHSKDSTLPPGSPGLRGQASLLLAISMQDGQSFRLNDQPDLMMNLQKCMRIFQTTLKTNTCARLQTLAACAVPDWRYCLFGGALPPAVKHCLCLTRAMPQASWQHGLNITTIWQQVCPCQPFHGY